MLILEHMLEQLFSSAMMKEWKSRNLKSHGFISQCQSPHLHTFCFKMVVEHERIGNLLRYKSGLWNVYKIFILVFFSDHFVQKMTYLYQVWSHFKTRFEAISLKFLYQLPIKIRAILLLANSWSFCSSVRGRSPASPQQLYGKRPRNQAWRLSCELKWQRIFDQIGLNEEAFSAAKMKTRLAMI